MFAPVRAVALVLGLARRSMDSGMRLSRLVKIVRSVRLVEEAIVGIASIVIKDPSGILGF
jgi:hypothetical protein